MSILGIVAEYNPFHNGHLQHLRAAVASVSPSAVLVALSGPFTQRGEPALLSPYVRAECALSAGADAVLALPVLWTVRDAEHYALGSVSLLASLGTTHLAFGAETADLTLLQKTADLLEDNPPALQDALHAALAEGRGYPDALAKAACACMPESAAVLQQSNNILAVCYLRAVRRLRLPVTPVVIPRAGSYHADRIESSAPSASAIRASLLRGVWQEPLEALPPRSAAAVRSSFLHGEVPDSRRLDALLLGRLRSMSPEDAATLPDCPEGLDAALLNSATAACSRAELIALLTTRRYSSARISRLCACALLGITRKETADLPLPRNVLLLGMKKNPSLSGSWKNCPVRVQHGSKWQKTADRADLEAWRLWTLACGLPASYPFTKRLNGTPG